MLNAIGMANYRTFPQRVEFEIAPITILLGANSSGKSSVTRLLPLFSQSLTSKSSAPVLWVSDILDYGSFFDNVHRNRSSENITFSFSGSFTSHNRTRRNALSSRILDPTSYNFQYDISIAGDRDSTRISCIQISAFNQVITLRTESGGIVDSISLNGIDKSDILRGRKLLLDPGLFPGSIWVRNKDDHFEVADSDEFIAEAGRMLRFYAHQNTAPERVNSILSVLPVASVEATMQRIEGRAAGIPSLKKNIKNISRNHKEHIWLYIFLANIDVVLGQIRSAIEPEIVAGGYLGPIRARASRYYRRQELAVEQIDPTGENLAMYFNSLRDFEREEINRDLSRFFGHTIKLHPGEGHISLRISADGDPHEDNLADVGFGFSQLLPVIAQVHAAARTLRDTRLAGTSYPSSPILAVEQPELHLHPAYQAKLGAYFVHAATEERKFRTPPFRFLIETHSEPLVNEVASLVAKGAIRPDQVRLYLFERQPGADGTGVVRAEIQEDGSIPNWPFGFFTTGKIRAGNKFQ